MGRPSKTPEPGAWKKVNLELPPSLNARWEGMKGAFPQRSVKLLGCAAFAVFFALPPGARQLLYRWAHRHELDPETIDLAEVLAILSAVLSASGTAVPPTESKAKKVDPKKPRPTLPPGTWEVVHPEQVVDGIRVQTIVRYSVAETPGADRPEDKRADGDGNDGEKGAA